MGKGTFCAIHKCIDLSYSHRNNHIRSPSPTLTADHGESVNGVVVDDDGGGGGGGDSNSRVTNGSCRKQRIVAAKVELANFVDSGVIDGEASVLKFLDVCLPEGMVPMFVDYVRQSPPLTSPSVTSSALSSSISSVDAHCPVVTPGEKSSSCAAAASMDGGLSAIIMEYLPGEDMHLLRDRHCQSLLLEKSENGVSSKSNSGCGSDGGTTTGEKVQRRLSVQDSVYLVAEVMLPLLKAMHEVGIVHRDVKPSVRSTVCFLSIGIPVSTILNASTRSPLLPCYRMHRMSYEQEPRPLIAISKLSTLVYQKALWCPKIPPLRISVDLGADGGCLPLSISLVIL